MNHGTGQDPLFEAVKRLLIETRIPSVAHVQVTFRIGYSRAASMLDAMEGDIVTPKDEHGIRRMLTGETRERDESEIISSPDWVDSGMRNFDSVFFNELAKFDALVKLSEYSSTLMSPRDGFRLRLSEMHGARLISDDFVRVTREFVVSLAKRSGGRYQFEMDFRVFPHQVFSYSQGRSCRKQLYISFDAYPPSDKFPCPWGASVGMGFDFRNEHRIFTECVNEYEAFQEKVFCEQELFDATFGSLGGYAEPAEYFKEPITAEKAWQTTPDMLQSWLCFGRRLTPDAITAIESLDGFVDECIRVFNVISEAGYYHVNNDAK